MDVARPFNIAFSAPPPMPPQKTKRGAGDFEILNCESRPHIVAKAAV